MLLSKELFQNFYVFIEFVCMYTREDDKTVFKNWFLLLHGFRISCLEASVFTHWAILSAPCCCCCYYSFWPARMIENSVFTHPALSFCSILCWKFGIILCFHVNFRMFSLLCEKHQDFDGSCMDSVGCFQEHNYFCNKNSPDSWPQDAFSASVFFSGYFQFVEVFMVNIIHFLV